jgi:hypothetical protein
LFLHVHVPVFASQVPLEPQLRMLQTLETVKLAVVAEQMGDA